MSTTLTNGLKLPDKGSVDWYSDMQNNYTILDGAVGTIAEHTTALAGKAPAVHTHTKSDITDLFNSANTWSANNTYSADCIIYNSSSSGSVARLQLRNSKAEVLSTGNTGSTQSITFRDKNDFSFGYIYGTVQSNGVAVKIGAYAKDSSNNNVNTELQILSFTNGNKALFPATANEYDLGISSFQWKSVQAQTYYYNGTAWGLDKANTWSNINSYTREICISGDRNAYIAPMLEGAGSGIAFLSLDASKKFVFGQRTTDANNRSCYDATKGFLTIKAGETGGDTNVSVIPFGSDTRLGDSTNKWKSFNGINPGALSLPRGYTEEGADKHYINIASTIQTLDGTLYYYTMPDNGWISVRAEQANQVHVTTDNWKFGQSIYSNTVTTLIVSTPFRKGDTVAIKVRAITLEHARFYPMQGNV